MRFLPSNAERERKGVGKLIWIFFFFPKPLQPKNLVPCYCLCSEQIAVLETHTDDPCLPQRRSVLSQADSEAICGIAVAQLLAFSEGCGAWRSQAARMALSRGGHAKRATGIGHHPGHQGASGYLNPAPTLDLIQDRLKSVEIFPLLPWAFSQMGSGVWSSWDTRQKDRRKA